MSITNNLPSTTPPVNDSRAVLNQYIQELETVHLRWYGDAALIHERVWHVPALISLLSGFASSLIAALLEATTFTRYGKILLIIVPAVGSLATALLTLFRFRELEDLRERGRITLEIAIANAKGREADPSQDPRKIHQDLVAFFESLSLAQHSGYHELLGKPFVWQRSNIGSPPPA